MGNLCGSSSSHADSSAAPVRRASNASANAGRSTNQRHPADLSTCIVGWDKDFPPMTASTLAARRAEFWDTRVQGRIECWQALRVAVEAAEADGNTATTHAILESAEMTPLETDRPGYCFSYDSKGFKYDLPIYCVYTPSNLLSDPPPSKPASLHPSQPLQVQPAPMKSASAAAAESHSSTHTSAGHTTNDATQTQTTGKSIKFKIRFSNGAADLLVDERTSCSIGQLKSMIQAKYPELTHDRTRIYYLGKYMVSDKWNLGEIGCRKDMVLQCFVPMKKAE